MHIPTWLWMAEACAARPAKLSRISAFVWALAMAALWAAPAQAQLSDAEATRLSQNADQHVIVIASEKEPIRSVPFIRSQTQL